MRAEGSTRVVTFFKFPGHVDRAGSRDRSDGGSALI